MTTEALELIQGRVLNSDELLDRVKKHMIIEHDADDDLILGFLLARVICGEQTEEADWLIWHTAHASPN